MKRTLLSVAITLTLAASASFVRGAGFTPIAVNPSSYNHDPVVEASAPHPLSDYVTATVDGGTNKAGNTWFEVGYLGLQTNGVPFTNGIPAAGSFVTNAAGDHAYQMPPDYHTNNVIICGHQNGAQTAIVPGGTLTFTTPRKFSGLSFLTASGNGPVIIGYTIHYADTSTESGNFTSLDWFNGATAVLNAAGRVSMGGGLANMNANPGVRLFPADVAVGNPTINIASIDLAYAGKTTAGNTNNQTGLAMIFAVSGALDGSTGFTNPVPVSGFTYDAVVEADAPPTTGGAVATQPVTNQVTGNVTNNITTSMDGGTSKLGNVWYEQGYYSRFPNTGIPAAGSTVNSAVLPASYTMASSYAGNCAWVVASNIPTANIAFATPTTCGALSFLCAMANGDGTLLGGFIPVVINFVDGSTETNALWVPDWFNRNLPMAYHSHGRMNPNNRSVNTTPDQFIDPFTSPPLPFLFDYRGLTLPGTRLFDAVINVTNTTSAITNITLNFTNGISTRVASVFAVSGAAPGSVPAVFGYFGTATPGQPLGATIAAGRVMTKAWEGSNNIVFSVTNIAGSSISYQWMKAPRGGGMRDKLYSFDYSPFVPVANGGRISGATSSALVISNALSADSGDYLCVASTAGGSTTSLVATAMLLTTNQNIFVGLPAGDQVTVFGGPDTGNNEGGDHAIDGVAQKWLSISLNNNVTPCQGPMGIIVTPVSGSSVATSLRFFTANDTQGRDPWDYFLEGSNDGGSTFSPITGGALKGTLTLPTGRNGTGSTPIDPLGQTDIEVDFANATAYKTYRISITNVIDRWRNSLMQVSEIQLLGTLVPNPPVWVRQPDSAITVFVGASPSFTVNASGYPPPRYQWYTNSTLVPGATNATYTFNNAQPANSGMTFSCTASNTFGTITSSSCTMTVITPPTQPYPVAVLADNPSGYWRLNEGPDSYPNNGTVAHDYRGGHNGSYSNVSIAVTGYNPTADSDTAADFGEAVVANSYVDGIKDVDFSRATNAVSGGTLSVEAWVFGGNQTVLPAIVSKGYNGNLAAGTATGTEQFALDITGSGTQQSPPRFRFLVRDALGNGYVAQGTNITYDVFFQSAWHHLLGVCNQPAGTVQLYVDGLLAGSGTIPTGAGILTQPLPMTIGARKGGGSTEYTNQWQGKIDDVAVYNTALSSGQALAHYYAAQRPPVFSLQPVSIHTNDNTTAVFKSVAYGPGTVTYQWYNSDSVNPTTPIGGQTSSNYSFTATTGANGNYYQVVAANAYGSVTSAVVQLTVESGAPAFLWQDLPASQTLFVGHIIQLHVDPSGTAPFTYQWQLNGVNLVDNYRTAGSTTSTLTIGYITNSDSANYACLVTGTATSSSTVDAITVTANTAPFGSGGFFTATGAQSEWNLQGTTLPVFTSSASGATIQMTSNLGSTGRSAWMNTKQNISAFTASFVYQVTANAGAGADGITFCIQNQSATALGGTGGSLSYDGISPSEAFQLNIYAPNTRGFGTAQNGTRSGFASLLPNIAIGDNTNQIRADMTYNGAVWSIKFTDLATSLTFTTNITVNIPTIVGASTAWVGFTGADGGVTSTQIVSISKPSGGIVSIKVQVVGGNLLLTWPSSAGAFLQTTPSLLSGWTYDQTHVFRVVGTNSTVTVPPQAADGFFRLQQFP